MNADWIAPAWQGFGLGAGLIIAIGAQNAYVLKLGLRRTHVFPVTTFCFLADALLIAAGAAGMGTLVASNPTLTLVAGVGGAAFLFLYGVRAFRLAFKPGSLKAAENGGGPGGLGPALGVAAALTFLNPHVYLDTVVLLGSIAGQYPLAERIVFGAGAVVASAVWFYGLGYGATLLAPVFAKPRAWQVLDALIGCVMWGIAFALIRGLVA